MRDVTIPRNVFIVLAALTGAWLTWDSVSYRLVTYSMWADYWEHSAALHAWLQDLWNPGNPHLADDSSSARYIPLFFVLTVIGKPLGLNAIDLMAVSAVINYLLVIAGIYLFCSIYFRNPWAPAVAFLVLFTGWGIPWIWSNLYELRSFFMTASYPSTFVFGLSMLSFWLTLAFMRGRVGFFACIGGMLLLSALMFISHPLTGVFGISASCLLALTERDAPLGLRGLVIAAMLGGALLAGLWPFFPVWDVILASSDEVDDRTWQVFNGIAPMLERARSGAWWHMFFDTVQMPVSLGPALLGVPLALWLLLRRSYLFIPLGALLMTGPLVLNVFFQVALAHRFMLYVVFFLHLAIVWAILELFARWQTERRSGQRTPAVMLGTLFVQALVIIAVIVHVGLLVGDYRGQHLKYTLQVIDKRASLPAGYDAPRLYRELTADIPDDAVVIGHRRLTWPLPTFRGKTVALPDNHENSLVADQFTRVTDVERFLAETASDAERQAIVQRYGVTHAVINTGETAPGLLAWLQANATLVVTVERYRMLRLN